MKSGVLTGLGGGRGETHPMDWVSIVTTAPALGVFAEGGIGWRWRGGGYI